MSGIINQQTIDTLSRRCQRCSVLENEIREQRHIIGEQGEELATRDAQLAEAAGINQPFTTAQLLNRLITATEYLLIDRDCDSFGYEEWSQAVIHGKARIESLSRLPAMTPFVPEMDEIIKKGEERMKLADEAHKRAATSTLRFGPARPSPEYALGVLGLTLMDVREIYSTKSAYWSEELFDRLRDIISALEPADTQGEKNE